MNKCLFFKGNLAKDTITRWSVNHVDEWTIYETIEVEENTGASSFGFIENNEKCSIIFTSPSAVNFS